MKKVYSYQLTVISLILFFLFTVTCPLSTVRAADSTPSADIQSKLDEFKKEIASKAAQLKQIVNKKLKNKAYSGKVKTISTTSLTLASDSGPKIVSVNQDTVYESKIKTRSKFSLKNIQEEDYLAALGDIDETQVLTAKKVILLNPNPSLNPKTYLWGQVISISDQLITLKGKDLKNTAVSLEDISQVNLNDFVILTGVKSKNDIFEAEFVHIIPQGFIRSKKTATPSASAKPTPGAKVATKSASPAPKKK